MKCTECGYETNYGANYCNNCGASLEKANDEIYNRTVWGYADKFLDWYDALTLKKITGNIIFKIVVLLLVLGIGIFNAYSSYANIRLLKSETYEIEYDKDADFYYIVTPEEEVNILLYIPKNAEKVIVRGITDGQEVVETEFLPDDYSKGIIAKKNEFDSISVDTIKDDAVSDSINLIVK